MLRSWSITITSWGKVANALDNLARLAETQGDMTRARDRYEEVLALRRAMHDGAGIAEAQSHIDALARHRCEWVPTRSMDTAFLDVVTRKIGGSSHMRP